MTNTSAHFAIVHTFPNGQKIGDGYIHGGIYADKVYRYYDYNEASEAAERMTEKNRGHKFEVVPFPNN